MRDEPSGRGSPRPLSSVHRSPPTSVHLQEDNSQISLLISLQHVLHESQHRFSTHHRTLFIATRQRTTVHFPTLASSAVPSTSYGRRVQRKSCLPTVSRVSTEGRGRVRARPPLLHRELAHRRERGVSVDRSRNVARA